jgi:acetate CoA/acetoacetate CoA-transferase alpha subunit
MIDKTCSITQALQWIQDGQTILFGGFGVPGTPFALIDGILNQGTRNLSIIKNEANEDGMGVSKLIEAHRVKKIITTHLGLNRTVIAMMNRGEVEVEFCPQGILVERIRAGGAGVFGILSDIGIDTVYRGKKQIIEFEGRPVIAEPAIRADVALVHAACADRVGNLVYEKTARNFSPIMVMAARRVIAEVEEIREIGQLDPDQIHTPGAFVDHVVVLEELTPEYGVFEKHVL